ncbi:ubiquitin-conjugating enzyme E2 T [Caerostris extrusa]|uniref:Ubiquitin-conjugating enzyme E2 T n=1 Tax=Caerostris extrusa TaxID=172846 RepID=A0AAV4WYK2_CAEEX|nr:ubiquitin-conjugating enzyme E2 T [Caerostris extrusa]
MQCSFRLKKELERFRNEPASGISLWPTENINQLKASIMGPNGTPYENGVFYIDIQVPDKYPFVPPNVHFITAIYHPNVDDSGRICLDTLKLPPQGSWKPSLNLVSILINIQLLMGEPNFNDPLMDDIDQPAITTVKQSAENFDLPEPKRMRF